ncbi:sensor histidine kinase [Siphonobacter aquaeclarae]|uniref:Histidine kinase n=1 Tax=Siphonobacter aquaeclarae TaxID=563176 RepID=A0A1G9HZM9_9BACT|nr:histidine kinase [Siphonobacter aquaeclarae]SDL18295.1 Histidine kinase [Siphonobacter aquaeclarae]
MTLNDQFTSRQKWQLALSVFVIYWPIRLYVNLDSWSWAYMTGRIAIWLIEVPLTILFFYFFISLAEWLRRRLLRSTDAQVLTEMSFPVQLATLGAAIALAVSFNIVFHWVLRSMDSFFLLQFPNRPKAPPPNWPADFRNYNRVLRGRMNNGLTVMAMLSAFYLAAYRRSSNKMQELEVRAERLEKESVKAQFMALKNQVNPHFLFNSLSILSSLVEIDPQLSVQFISRLSKAYRYILEQRDNDSIHLKTELEFIRAYTFLLNIRFDGKLQVHIDVSEEEAGRYFIAPLTLQLLVENAVKHNRMSAGNPLIVTIKTENDYLVVSNPIQLRPDAEHSTGVGLQNIINRYGLLTDRPVSAAPEDGCFVIRIPLLTEQ